MWILLFLFGTAFAQDWSANNYPNPRKNFKECSMRSSSSVCDPDQVLTESERYRLNNELNRLSQRSETGSNSFCSRKGIDGVLVIVPNGSLQFADALNKKYALDGQCGRSAVFLLSTNDRKMYLAEDSNTGLDQAQFQAVVASEDNLLRTGQYTAALINIFKELGRAQTPFESTTPESHKTCAIFTFIPVFLLSIVAIF